MVQLSFAGARDEIAAAPTRTQPSGAHMLQRGCADSHCITVLIQDRTVAVRAVRCRAGSWLYKAEHLNPISVFRQPNQVQDIAAGLTVEPDEESGINHRE
jgi:hypothetical protein